MTARHDALTHAQACRDALAKGAPRPVYAGADMSGATLCDAELDGARIMCRGEAVTIRFEREGKP